MSGTDDFVERIKSVAERTEAKIKDEDVQRKLDDLGAGKVFEDAVAPLPRGAVVPPVRRAIRGRDSSILHPVPTVEPSPPPKLDPEKKAPLYVDRRPKPEEGALVLVTDEEIKSNPIWHDNELVKMSLRAMMKYRHIPAMIISGPAGIGKTFAVRQIHHEFGIKYRPIRPSPSKLTYITYHSPKHWVFTMDDYDEIYDDVPFVGKMKSIFDSTTPRLLSNDVHGKTYIPEHEVHQLFINITNRDFRDMAQFPRRIRTSMLPAILDRCPPIQFTFEWEHVREWVLWRAPVVLKAANIENVDPLSVARRNEILGHLDKNSEEYKMMSLRMVWHLGMFRLAFPIDHEWEIIRRRYFLRR